MAGRIAAVSLYVFFYCLLHLSVQGKYSFMFCIKLHKALSMMKLHIVTDFHKYLLNYTLKCPAVVYNLIPTVWCADIYNLCH